MNSPAMRSVWKIGLPIAVRLVTKNVRDSAFAFCAVVGRDGLLIAGAKAPSFLGSAHGTTEVVP